MTYDRNLNIIIFLAFIFLSSTLFESGVIDIFLVLNPFEICDATLKYWKWINTGSKNWAKYS